MKKKLNFIPIFVIIIAMIIIGSIFDLQINKAIYDPNNVFGLTMAAVGEAPGYATIGLFGGGFFFLGLKKYEKVWQKILLIGLGTASLIAAVYFQGKHVIDENAFNIESEAYAWPLIALPVGLLVGGLGFGAGFFLSKTSDNPQLLKMFIVMASVTVVAVGLTTLIKNIMLRPRYRFIALGSDSDFLNWWQDGKSFYESLNGSVNKEEFKSFPSGHATSTALCIMSLTYLPMFKSKWLQSKKLQTILIYVGLAWTLLMCFARMLIGAHYLTDVGFGFAIVMTLFFIADFIFYKKPEFKVEVSKAKI